MTVPGQGHAIITLPSSLRVSYARSAFHQQGLARLGATPFRDAVTILIGKVLRDPDLRDVPASGRALPPVHLEEAQLRRG